MKQFLIIIIWDDCVNFIIGFKIVNHPSTSLDTNNDCF